MGCTQEGFVFRERFRETIVTATESYLRGPCSLVAAVDDSVK
jgi:hypothetical protein